MTTIGIHQPQYLPWLGLIERISNCDIFVLLDNVPYSKNYFYNRNRIRTSNGWCWLTIPIKTAGRAGQLIKDTEINNNIDWQRGHRQSIYFAYKKSGFFNEYFPPLDILYSRRWDRLTDIAIEMLQFVLKSFAVKTPIIRASELAANGRKEELLINICQELKAEKYFSGPDGANYLNLDIWRRASINVEFQHFRHPLYRQMHGEFISQMAALDLLFNEGPSSKNFINNPAAIEVEMTFK